MRTAASIAIRRVGEAAALARQFKITNIVFLLFDMDTWLLNKI